MLKKRFLRGSLSCLFLLLFLLTIAANPVSKQIQIPFFTETISIRYSEAIIVAAPRKMEEESIVTFYNQLNRSPYQSVVKVLKNSRQRYRLNDWLTYDLIEETINQIYSRQPKSYKVLATWFFISKLNYDTRLTFLGR